MSSAPTAPGLNIRVMLIEDNPKTAEALQRVIERDGMRTAWAQTGAQALELKASFTPDIVLVDLELPDVNGVSLIGWLSGLRDCGIIVVSAHGDDADRVLGLELGADDYITKPPNPRELVARIRALNRRVKGRLPAQPEPLKQDPLLVLGSYEVDLRQRLVTRAGQPIELTSAEFAALELLLLASGQPVSRDRMSEAVLRRPWRPDDRSVDQLIFRLRQKLAIEPDQPQLIHSIRGAGYLLRLPDIVPR